MAKICNDFRRALDNTLSVTEFSDVFQITSSGDITVNREAIKGLSIQLLTKTGQLPTSVDDIIDIVTSNFEDEDLNTLQIQSISDIIIKEYTRLKYLRKELIPNKVNKLPKLTNSLTDSFLGDNTLKLFSKWMNTRLVESSVIYNKASIVKSIADLNFSIQSLKQNFVDDLSRFLNMDPFGLYKNIGTKGSELDIIKYNLLIEEAKNIFSSRLIDGKYKSNNDIAEDNAYYSYYALLNFDKLITNSNFSDILGLSRTGLNFKGSNTVPLYNIAKYEFTFQQISNQRWDEDLSKDNDSVNPLVRKFIETQSLVERQPDGVYKEIPNQYLNYRNFKEILRTIKEHPMSANYYASIRHNPYSITSLFEYVNNNRNTIFSGRNTHLRRLFDTMYYKLFSNNPQSLNSLSSNTLTSEFDIYGMILNQINKTSYTTYVQYIYDLKTKSNGATVLNSADIEKKKYTIERSIMVNSLYKQSRISILNKWNVDFQNANKESMNYYKEFVSDPIGLSTIVLSKDNDTIEINLSDINNPVYTLNGIRLTKQSLINNAEFRVTLEQLLKDFIFIPTDDIYIHLLSQIIDSDAKLDSILDVITASLLNMNIVEQLNEKPSPHTITNSYPNLELTDSNSSWKYFNPESKSMKMSGFFSSLKGLELLATVQSIINGDNSKSNVTDANGNKLQKERLSNLTNDEYFYFDNLIKNSFNDITQDNVINYNLFTTDNKLLSRTELKTHYNSFYSQDPKKISNATDPETNYIYFIHDYLTRMGEVSIQPTVYSDKSTIWNKVINTTLALNMDWIPPHLKGKTLDEMSAEEIREIKYASTKGMAKVYLDKVISDYQTLVNTNVFGNYEELISTYDLNNSNKIKQYENYLSLFRELANNQLVEQALRHIKHTTGELITIIDQIHWLPGFKVNPSLYEFFKLYSSDNVAKYNKQESLNKALYALKLQEATKIELSYNNGKEISEITTGIKDKLEEMSLSYDSYKKNWINEDTNELILFKAFNKNGEVKFLTQTNVLEDGFEIELNPLLDKYLSLDNLISSNYNSLVYGLEFIHPAKSATSKSLAESKSLNGEEVNKSDYFKFKESDIIIENANRTNASYKRAVIGGATIHTWLKNKVNGIPNKLKIAVIEDPSDFVSNIHGDVGKVDMYDGGIWMNPFQAIWEKNSVEEVKQSSIHRKPIGYFAFPDYLSSGLMKCATFSVNNAMIRNSIGKNSAEGMLKKMTNEPWIIPIQLTLSQLKSKRKLNNSSVYLKDAQNGLINPRYKEIVNNSGIQNIAIKEVIGLDYVNSNIGEDGNIHNWHNITIGTSDLSGKVLSTETQLVDINSNYSLWKILGGDKSISYNNTYDESSIEVVANLASALIKDPEKSISELLALTSQTPLELITKYPKYSNSFIRKIQKSGKYFQPLKLSDVSYLANHSAIKNGAANMIETSNYYNDSDLLYIEVDPDFIGIQMSAEHDAENSEVSEMTQVMSALIQKGISYETTLSIYRDLGSYIAKGLQPFMNTNNNQLILTLGKQLLKSFDVEDLSSENLASRYIKLIKEDLLENDVDKELLIPFDDPSIFSKFVIDFANNLNQSIIRRKFFGLNAVLNPSHDVIGLIEYVDDNGNIQLYTKEDYETKNNVPIIESIPNTMVDPGEIVNGDWVIDEGIEKQVSVRPIKDGRNHINLQQLREKARATNSQIEKINKYGRNLRAHNYTFNLGERGMYDGFDLDSSKLSYSLFNTLQKITFVSDTGEVITESNDIDVMRFKKFINFIKSGKSLYIGDLKTNIEYINNAINKKEGAFKKVSLAVKEWIMADCKMIELEQKFPSLVEWSGENLESIPLNGSAIYSANEMLLPKVWATKYMIKEDDNLGTILEDPIAFFTTKLYDRYDYSDLNDIKPDKAIAALKGLNPDNNLYVLLKEDFNEEDWTPSILDTALVRNRVYVVNDNGEPLYPIKKGMRVYTRIEQGESITAIVINEVSDLNYLENLSTFSELVMYSANNIDMIPMLKASKLISPHLKNSLLENLNLGNFLSNEDIEQLYTSSDIQINTAAQKMAISFKNAALNFIVARIPAQSMQSFMNMSIKGFINTDSNVVYVCDSQLWLQGSDYWL